MFYQHRTSLNNKIDHVPQNPSSVQVHLKPLLAKRDPIIRDPYVSCRVGGKRREHRSAL